MSDIKQPYYIFKICILGQAAVGKTCIAKRLCFNTFDIHTKLTIGLDFYTYDIPIIVDKTETFIRLSIWDFGGQEQFRKFFPYYINGANGIMMIFNLVNIETLIGLDWWYEKLNEHNHEQTPKVIIGTKKDLINHFNEKVHINNLIINQFMKKHNEKDFFETSSKSNYNIFLSFKELVRKVLEKNKLEYERLL